MRMKRISCMVFACMLIIGVIGVPANAAETETITPESYTMNLVSPRATESFNITVGAKKTASADKSFPMAKDETIRIQAYYSPSSASVDFGILDSEGTFYYFNTTNGNIDKTIQIDANGDYTLTIRNNSSSEVEVVGFVNY